MEQNRERYAQRLTGFLDHADPELREILRPLWQRLGVTRHFHPASFWWRHQG
ncbi:hypothetical protein ACO0M4_00965 [Streptomyces sp. RGM 3693]|uniref:hypothetical protein n=1 Tax=Streptomyces sp. RGM 3693 TaxID=3413284 RepID=UPI003D2A4454